VSPSAAIIATARPRALPRPFTDVVARPLPGGRWVLMNRQEDGYSSYGFEYGSLAEIPDRWAVVQGEDGKDEHGAFVRFRRAP